jgi:heptosyltransferase-2
MARKRCKILIVRFSSLGDLILMTPLIKALNEGLPESEIHVACKAKYVDIFTENKHINRVYMLYEDGLSGLFRLLRKLRSERYDVVVDAHNVPRSRFICHLLRAGTKVRIDKQHTKKLMLIRGKVNLFERIDTQIGRYLQLARRLGIDAPDLATELSVPASADERIEDILVREGMVVKPVIAVAPGARWETKRWPVEHFIGFIGAMVKRGVGIILIGGKDETALNAEISAQCPGTLDLTGSLSILETGAALRRCDCLVTNDSAPLHIAEAVGTPVIAIFGPTVREFGYYPHLPRSVALEVDLTCRPCSRNGSRPCPLGTKECLVVIQPERIIAAAENLVHIDGMDTIPSPTGDRSHG